MENWNPQQPFNDCTIVEGASQSKTMAKTYMANVFLWMFAALGISAFFAAIFANTPYLFSFLLNASGQGLSILGWAVMFAPLGFVLLMSFAFQRLSSPALISLFVLYSAVNGISFSFILLAYTAGSVIGCFAAAAGMFGLMAVMGYTTDKDLTSFGRIMTMGLVGIVLAMLINFFLKSNSLDYIISIVGVMVFTGLTAYDVQKLKRIGEGIEYEGVDAENTRKMSVIGALTLYLDFVNLFLMLLRLFGGRRD